MNNNVIHPLRQFFFYLAQSFYNDCQYIFFLWYKSTSVFSLLRLNFFFHRFYKHPIHNKMETTVDKQNSNTTYVGRFPNLSMESLLSVIPLPINGETISLIRIFIGKYRAILCVLSCMSSVGKKLLHASIITDYIRDELKHDLDIDRITATYDYETGRISISSRISDLNNGVIIEMAGIYLSSGLDNPNQYKPDYSDDQFLILSGINFYFLPENRMYVQDSANCFFLK